MDDHRLEKIRKLVLRGNWIPSQHVIEDYLITGECTREDIEQSVLTGRIYKVEKDPIGTALDGKVYTISGKSVYGLGFETAGKIIKRPDGNFYFVITAYKYRRT